MKNSKLDVIKKRIKNISDTDIELQTAYFRKFKNMLNYWFQENEITEMSATTFAETFNTNKEKSLKILIVLNADFFNKKII